MKNIFMSMDPKRFLVGEIRKILLGEITFPELRDFVARCLDADEQGTPLEFEKAAEIIDNLTLGELREIVDKWVADFNKLHAESWEMSGNRQVNFLKQKLSGRRGRGRHGKD